MVWLRELSTLILSLDPGTAIGRALCIGILLLLLAAMLAAAVHGYELFLEKLRLRRLDRTFPEPLPAEPPCTKGAFGALLQSLWKAKATGGKTEPEFLIAAYTEELEGGFLPRFLELTPALAVMMGLVGTFLGLAGVVGELHQVLTAIDTESSVENLLRSMGTALQGLETSLSAVRTAFSTSLLGVTAALWTHGVCLFLDSRRSKVVAASLHVLAAEILPRLEKDRSALLHNRHEVLLDALQQRTEALIVSLAGFGDDLGRQRSLLGELLEGFLDHTGTRLGELGSVLDTTGSAAATSLQNLSGELDRLVATYQGMLTASAETTATTLQQHASLLGSQLETASTQLSELSGSGVELLKQMLDSFEHTQTRLEQGSLTNEQRLHEQFDALLGRLADRFEGLGTKLEHSSQRAAEVLERNSLTLAESLTEAGTRGAENLVQGSREAANAAVTIVDNTMQTLRPLLDTLGHTLETGGNRLGRSVENLVQDLEQGRVELKDLAQQFSEAFQHEGETNRELRAAVQELGMLLRSNTGAVLELNSDGQGLLQLMHTQAQRLEQREDSLEAQQVLFSEWLDRAGLAVESVATSLREAAQRDQTWLEDQHEQLRSPISELSQHLGSLHGDLRGLREQLEQQVARTASLPPWATNRPPTPTPSNGTFGSTRAGSPEAQPAPPNRPHAPEGSINFDFPRRGSGQSTSRGPSRITPTTPSPKRPFWSFFFKQ